LIDSFFKKPVGLKDILNMLSRYFFLRYSLKASQKQVFFDLKIIKITSTNSFCILSDIFLALFPV